MDKLHHIVAEIKRYYQDYGKPPSISELRAMGHSKYIIEKHTMRQLCEMAGVNEVRVNVNEVKKITNDIFKTNIETHINSYIPRTPIEQPKWSKMLILGDFHAPFHSERALEEVVKFCEIFQPKYIIQMGDVFDMYSHSKFPRSHNIFTPKEEEALAREAVENMWKSLKAKAPKATCYQVLGNHDARPLKRVVESLPTMEHWVQGYFKEIMTFDGVTTMFDIREELEIDQILFTHGFLHSEGRHRDYYLRNVVFGHLHKLWVQYRRFHRQTFWEMCCGFLGEPESKGLTYQPSKQANYQLGFSAIDQFGPRVIHL